ncbi:MAG: DUF4422 domain-containing protein [Clostridiales bacterium]|nr:DUF4422 domain-containing protein [Clostridiales bacterium]
MSKINILISCHKDFNTLKNDVFMPIQVGAAINNTKINSFLHDNDSLDNISHKNKSYCEMIAIYYAWKNMSADYFGLFHYRRYLSFSENLYKKI